MITWHWKPYKLPLTTICSTHFTTHWRTKINEAAKLLEKSQIFNEGDRLGIIDEEENVDYGNSSV